MAEAMDVDEKTRKISPKQEKRLEYLLEQAEIFSHFVGNSPKQASKRKLANLRNTNESTANRRRNNKQSKEDENANENEMKTAGVRFETTPSYIQGVMRDYQLRGLNWLISLYESNVNGILADEMGLGKTLQTISMLGFLKSYEKINGPFLVVGPKSTLRNWYNEVNRFCSSLKAVILIGDKNDRSETLRQMSNRNSWDVCLTTYEMCLVESSGLKKFKWEYLVVDEAHRLKNENSRLSKILRTFKCDNRLLLTGTPLQNNLHELWALLNFLLPDVFASADDFDTWFDSDDCLKGNNDIVNRLRSILRPFMLRRIKSEVEKSLLPKIELKLYVGLTPLQRETYKKVLSKELTKMNEMGEESTKAINMILMELRKAANHPYLIDGVEPGPPYTTDKHLIDCCGKMMVLDKLLAKLKSQGSRVVLFSQFTMMLDIVEDYLGWRGHEFRRLDGQTPYEDRATNIDEFNAENSNIFIYIISTRAGGLGINLATADTVIIYDSDWNPQPDFQAIDRVHRIGQKKQVRVFRLITENTVDERIVQRAEIKSRLDRMIIQQGRTIDKSLTDTTKGMKRDMIRFGVEQIMSSSGGSDVIDVDIDKILSAGELKTAEENAKYAKLGESELRNLTLEEASSVSVYQFEGVDFRSKKRKSSEIDEPYEFRQRTATNLYTANRQNLLYQIVPVEPKPPAPRLKNLPDFHFYPRALLDLCDHGDGWINMATDTTLKKGLLSHGFPDWRKNDLRIFCNAMARFGRNNLELISAEMPDKTLEEVTKYHKAFWSRGPTELKDFDRSVALIKAKEEKIAREKNIFEALEWKMSCYRKPEIELSISTKYLHTKQLNRFTKQDDNYLLITLFNFGYNDPQVYNRIRQEILKSKSFTFNWFMRSRTANELQERIKLLLTAIQREYLEKTTKERSNSSRVLSANASNVTKNVVNGVEEANDSKINPKKGKSKPWKPVVRFSLPNQDESSVKENNAIESSSHDIPTNNQQSKTLTAPSELDMPLLD